MSLATLAEAERRIAAEPRVEVAFTVAEVVEIARQVRGIKAHLMPDAVEDAEILGVMRRVWRARR